MFCVLRLKALLKILNWMICRHRSYSVSCWQDKRLVDPNKKSSLWSCQNWTARGWNFHSGPFIDQQLSSSRFHVREWRKSNVQQGKSSLKLSIKAIINVLCGVCFTAKVEWGIIMIRDFQFVWANLSLDFMCIMHNHVFCS